MLIGVPPLLTPDLLYAIASMGHGDEIVIVDANFPATSVGRRVLDVAGASASATLDAILTLMPLDALVSPAVFTMEVVGDPRAKPDAVADFETVIGRRVGDGRALGTLERQAFYERSRRAFAVVRTGDGRRYANVLLVKGVVRPG